MFSKSTMVRSKQSPYLMHGPEVLSKPTMVRSKPPSYLMGAPDVLSKPTMVRSTTSQSLTELDVTDNCDNIFIASTSKSIANNLQKRALHSSVYTFIYFQQKNGVKFRV